LRSIFGAVLFCSVILFSAQAQHAQSKGYRSRDNDDTRPLLRISLIQLIANPAAYNGKNVEVIGFLHLEFEGDALYLHREDFEMALTKNSVWIRRPQYLTKAQIEAINNRYVLCVGVFRADRNGHMGLFTGEIGQITHLELWPRGQR
jgi:hypothetical protein